MLAPGGLAGRIRQALRPRLQRLALGVLGSLLLTAALADVLASDLPLALYRRGELQLLPSVLRPSELRALDNQRLMPTLTPDDWAVLPPVAWGQNGHDLDAVLEAPSRRHWLGTDSAGRDVLARIVHGARVSLTVGALSVVLLSCIGLVAGVFAAYYGRWADALLMRVVDVLHAAPTLLLIVTLLTVMRPTGYTAVWAMLTVIGLVRWTDLARLVRAESLRVCASPYVEAARVLGLSSLRIIARHVVPNVLSPVLVAASFSMAGAIALEGGLSFLGFGVPDDLASWGGLLHEARDHAGAWWLAVFPGSVMFLAVTALNVVGDALRDALDPRLAPDQAARR